MVCFALEMGTMWLTGKPSVAWYCVGKMFLTFWHLSKDSSTGQNWINVFENHKKDFYLLISYLSFLYTSISVVVPSGNSSISLGVDSLLRSRSLSRQATLLPTNGCWKPNHFPFPTITQSGLAFHFLEGVCANSSVLSLSNHSQSHSLYRCGKAIKMVVLKETFDLLFSRFQISSLNDHQKEAIWSIVVNNKDVLVNLPTGFGKTLIYQTLLLVFDHVSKVTGHIVCCRIAAYKSHGRPSETPDKSWSYCCKSL